MDAMGPLVSINNAVNGKREDRASLVFQKRTNNVRERITKWYIPTIVLLLQLARPLQL